MPRGEGPPPSFTVYEGGPSLPEWQAALRSIKTHLEAVLHSAADRARVREGLVELPQSSQGESGAGAPLEPPNKEVYHRWICLSIAALVDYAAACFLLETLKEEPYHFQSPDQWPLLQMDPQAQKAYGQATPAEVCVVDAVRKEGDIDRQILSLALQHYYGPPPLYLKFLGYLQRKVADDEPTLQRAIERYLLWETPLGIEQTLLRWARFFSALKTGKPFATPREATAAAGKQPTEWKALQEELEEIRKTAYYTFVLLLGSLIEPLETPSKGKHVLQTLRRLVGMRPLPKTVYVLGDIWRRLPETKQTLSEGDNNTAPRAPRE